MRKPTATDALDFSTQRAVVLLAIRRAGGLTRNEIATETRLPVSTVCGRVAELLRSGEIVIATKRESRVSGYVNEELRALERGAFQASLKGWT